MACGLTGRLVALVGRPNVGKSTLFNRIAGGRHSLVFDQPGVTRDRLIRQVSHDGVSFALCDTGGFEPKSQDPIKSQLVWQAGLAVDEAEVIVLVVDAREGLHPVDGELMRRFRKSGKRFLVAANKCDLPKDDAASLEFRRLGTEHVYAVSGEHGRGVAELVDAVTAALPPGGREEPSGEDCVRLALVGRPNVGKSSLLNRLAGTDRALVDDRPGTTRDSVDIRLRAFGTTFTVVDTAGIRRKSRMEDRLESFSAFRSAAS